MASKQSKAASDRNARLVADLAKLPGNNFCADCWKAPNSRWSSVSLGIFICEACCGHHRNIGTHLSRVKSLTLDLWTKEMVDQMKVMGNEKSNKIFNPNNVKPPTQSDGSSMLRYIKDKYEYKKFMLAEPAQQEPEFSEEDRPNIPKRASTSTQSSATPPLPRRPTSSARSRSTSIAAPPLPSRPGSSSSSQPQPTVTPAVRSIWDDTTGAATNPQQPLYYTTPLQANSVPRQPLQHAYQMPFASPSTAQALPSPTNPFFAMMQQQSPAQPLLSPTNPFFAKSQQQANPYFQQSVQQSYPMMNQAYDQQQYAPQSGQQYWNA